MERTLGVKDKMGRGHGVEKIGGEEDLRFRELEEDRTGGGENMRSSKKRWRG